MKNMAVGPDLSLMQSNHQFFTVQRSFVSFIELENPPSDPSRLHAGLESDSLIEKCDVVSAVALIIVVQDQKTVFL